MASAYTPGLKIVAKTLVEKERKLPLKGQVLVKKGDKVTAETVVASTDLPGNVYPLNVANLLGCEAREITDFLVRKEGDVIEINIPEKKLELKVSQDEIKKRFEAWKCPEPKIKTGVIYRYAKSVTSASTGAVFKD